MPGNVGPNLFPAGFAESRSRESVKQEQIVS